MTTAEAIVATLLAHGIDTLYALPGVQNDHLFDACSSAGDALRTVHTRHEQGAAYMALGAALATGKPQAYAVVPGPGLLNSGAALLTAYAMNAPVLALIGEIPDAEIGRGLGHLHEIRDQAGIIARLVDHSARIREPAEAPASSPRRCVRWPPAGPARPRSNARSTSGASARPSRSPSPPPARRPRIDEDAIRAAAKLLGAAKRSADRLRRRRAGCSAEVTALSAMLQAPVLGYRRGRGVLDGRDPLSVTLPLGRELWGEADVGARRRHPHAHPVHAMGHRRRSRRSPRRCRSARSRRACTSRPSR